MSGLSALRHRWTSLAPVSFTNLAGFLEDLRQSPMPPPSQTLNRYHLAGRSGDTCLVVWDQTASDWVIAQVAHHEIEVPLKYRFALS
ncbi:MAG: hypothetical protein ACKO38_15095 [Planctomycetota bacterium]